MLGVALRAAAPMEVKEGVANLILGHEYVTDINLIRIVQEGPTYHVDSYIELITGLTLADADDIKMQVTKKSHPFG